jgi:cytochrome P450
VTTTTADVYFDLYDRDLYFSPYAMYTRLRDEVPLYYNEEYKFYAVSRFDDVARVLSDRDAFISGKGGVYQFASLGVEMPEGMFIFEDPPGHTIHRRLVSRLFTPKAINRLEPMIMKLFHEQAQSLVGRDRFDYIKDFANYLPIAVIGMLIGLPESDFKALRDTFHRTMHAGTADRDGDAMSGIADIGVFFSEYLDYRTEHPTDDLMTELLNLEFEDKTGTRRQLQREELLLYLIIIAGAGSDTTVNSIGWLGQLLGDHPDQRRMLVADPSLIPNAVEESLRYEPPSYHIARTVATDVELHGTTVPADSVIITLPGAANRDDRHYPDGDTFDITRKVDQQFAFSFGPHFCLGASLARLETRIATEAILQRFPDFTVDHDNAALTEGIDTRGWDHFPVDVEK